MSKNHIHAEQMEAGYVLGLEFVTWAKTESNFNKYYI